MKIEKGQLIAGQSVLKVRDFFKRYERYDVENAAYFFAISKKAAKILCSELVELGYSQRTPAEQMAPAYKKEIWYNLLPLGRSLRLARAVPPITREKADRILEEFMERVHEVNSSKKYLYKVAKVLVFGSYLRADINELNDIDIGIELMSKYSDPDTRVKKDLEYAAVAMQNGQRFGTFVDKLYFPQAEIKKILRSKSLYISLHTPDDQVLKTTETKQIYPKSFIDKLVDLLP